MLGAAGGDAPEPITGHYAHIPGVSQRSLGTIGHGRARPGMAPDGPTRAGAIRGNA